MMDLPVLWVGFNVLILVLLILDLAVFHRKPSAISVKDALVLTATWIALAVAFNIFVYFRFGEQKAMEFLTGYVIEKSLSIDNIFVFIMIFSYFNVPPSAQHKVLFWGIIGALVMRGIFIFLGIELIHQFHWLIYLFGAFLVYTGITFLSQGDVKVDPEKNVLVRSARKLFRITPSFKGNRFFVLENKKLWATPLLLVVILVETTDLIFAVDSIPAIIAISDDMFIVYTSNVFAILGLRSLYFALAGIEKYFQHLKYALSVILVFVGIKMCISDFYKIPIELSLLFILTTLLLAVILSVILQKKESKEVI